MNLQFDIIEILKVTMVLFAVIDVIGSIPIIISLKQKTGGINASKASVVSFGIMIVFLFSFCFIYCVTIQQPKLHRRYPFSPFP